MRVARRDEYLLRLEGYALHRYLRAPPRCGGDLPREEGHEHIGQMLGNEYRRADGPRQRLQKLAKGIEAAGRGSESQAGKRRLRDRKSVGSGKRGAVPVGR